MRKEVEVIDLGVANCVPPPPLPPSHPLAPRRGHADLRTSADDVTSPYIRESIVPPTDTDTTINNPL